MYICYGVARDELRSRDASIAGLRCNSRMSKTLFVPLFFVACMPLRNTPTSIYKQQYPTMACIASAKKKTGADTRTSTTVGSPFGSNASRLSENGGFGIRHLQPRGVHPENPVHNKPRPPPSSIPSSYSPQSLCQHVVSVRPPAPAPPPPPIRYPLPFNPH